MSKHLIYIAGALRADVPTYISNCSKMIKTAEKVRRQGYAVYIPCLDLIQGLVMSDLSFSDYFDNSAEVLTRCDAVFLCEGWESSKGTQHEIEIAGSLNIPVFESIDDLTRNL